MPAFVKKQPIKRGNYVDTFTDNGEGDGAAINLIPWASKLTSFIIGRAQRKTDAYTKKATTKQIDAIVERFNKL